MKNKQTLTVICPAYNEEEVISFFYESISKTLKDCSELYDYKMLFVLDGCTDNTFEILKNIAKKDSYVQIISLSKNFGHQMCLVAGMDHTESDIIIMMDSDLQHPPELIPKLLRNYEEGYDIVYTVRKEIKAESFFKRLTSRWFYSFLRILSSLNLSPGEADFRLVSRKVADVFKYQVRERNQFLRGLFSWVGFNRVGVEYTPNPRAAGISKIKGSRRIRFASDGIVSFSKKPLQYAGFFGIIIFLLSIILIIFYLFSFINNNSSPSGFTSIALLISFFGGIQLLFLGILGEYIGAVFDEAKARPLYLVDKSFNVE